MNLENKKCKARRRDGEKCEAWQATGSANGFCYRHGGFAGYYKWVVTPAGKKKWYRPRPVCRCKSYPFPHRKNSGRCKLGNLDSFS